MGYTKRDFVLAALTEIGIASSSFQIMPDELTSAVNRLDAMMAEWDASGIHLGYPLATPTTTDVNAETSVYPYAVEAVTLNLAVRLAPQYGREVMPSTMASAKAAKSTVIMRMTAPPNMSMPVTMPLGNGAKPWLNTGNPFVAEEDEEITVAREGDLTFTG